MSTPLSILEATTKTSARAQKQRNSTKGNRFAKHFLNEECRRSDQRLLTRTDLDDFVSKIVSRATQIQYAASVRSFTDVCEDVLELGPDAGKASDCQLLLTYFPSTDVSTQETLLASTAPSRHENDQAVHILSCGRQHRSQFQRKVMELQSNEICLRLVRCSTYCNQSLDSYVRR